MTITPEIIAFVVAMAGIILPAMAMKIREERHQSQNITTVKKKFKKIIVQV